MDNLVPDPPVQGAIDLTESPEPGPRLTVQEQAEADAQRQKERETEKRVDDFIENLTVDTLLDFQDPKHQAYEDEIVSSLVYVGEKDYSGQPAGSQTTAVRRHLDTTLRVAGVPEEILASPD